MLLPSTRLPVTSDSVAATDSPVTLGATFALEPFARRLPGRAGQESGKFWNIWGYPEGMATPPNADEWTEETSSGIYPAMDPESWYSLRCVFLPFTMPL